MVEMGKCCVEDQLPPPAKAFHGFAQPAQLENMLVSSPHRAGIFVDIDTDMLFGKRKVQNPQLVLR